MKDELAIIEASSNNNYDDNPKRHSHFRKSPWHTAELSVFRKINLVTKRL